MSLESKIEQLIEALNANTAALEGRVQTQLPLAAAPEIASAAPTETPPTPEGATTKRTRKKTDAPVAEVVPFVAPVVETPPAPTKSEAPAEITADSIREIAHAIINARKAKNLLPANAVLVALNEEYGLRILSEAADSPKAGEVFAKLQAILKEVA